MYRNEVLLWASILMCPDVYKRQALGADSTTRSATNVTSATVAGHTYGGFAGTSPVGSVSVGKAGQDVYKRQVFTSVNAKRHKAKALTSLLGIKKLTAVTK